VQEKVLACESALIDQLKKLRLDEDLLHVLRDVSMLLMEGTHESTLCTCLREAYKSMQTRLFAALEM